MEEELFWSRKKILQIVFIVFLVSLATFVGYFIGTSSSKQTPQQQTITDTAKPTVTIVQEQITPTVAATTIFPTFVEPSVATPSPIVVAPADRNVIMYDQSETGPIYDSFSTYNIKTREKKKLFDLPDKHKLADAVVSPDGKKLYYRSIDPTKGFNSELVIRKNDGSSKNYKMSDDPAWIFDAGPVYGDITPECQWAADSIKIACPLTYMTKDQTAYMKIFVLDTETGKITDVFTNDLIAKPVRSQQFTHFYGWITEKIMLFIYLDTSNTNTINPADFYAYNIESKKVEKLFSYLYEPGFNVVISNTGNEIYFVSNARDNDYQFVRYTIPTHVTKVIVSSKDPLQIRKPSFTADQKNIIYPSSLKKIHIYNPTNDSESTVSAPVTFSSIAVALPGNTQFLLESDPGYSVLFDSTTNQTEDVKGTYIGYGSF